MRYGSWIGNAPSRFIGEIPTSLLEIAGGDETPRRGYVAREDRGAADAPEPSEQGSFLSKRFRKGAAVIHPNYGEGTIRKVEGSGKDMKVTVHFPGHGEKKFLVAYAPFRFA
jgi:DNA helicase-2/ATP-dependent DNA helicase PcrA